MPSGIFSFLTRTLLGAYGAVWQAAKPVLRRHTRLAEGFEERLVPEGWPWRTSYAGEDSPLPAPESPCLWIQAASGGEAWLVHSLSGALREHPALAGRSLTLLCTTCTRQGLDILTKLAGDIAADAPGKAVVQTNLFDVRSEPSPEPEKASPASGCAYTPNPTRITILPRYMPLDAPSLMERAMHLAAPKAVVLLETELWPGLLAAAKKAAVPVLVLNGRLTGKSLSSYQVLRSFWREHAPERVLAVSEEDAARFSALFGAERVGRMSNIKFDRVAADAAPAPGATPVPGGSASSSLPAGDARALTGIPPQTLLLALASVREEEEELLLPVIRNLHGLSLSGCPVRVAVAPRHMHRVDSWQKRLADAGISVVLRSAAANQTTTANPEEGRVCPPAREAGTAVGQGAGREGDAVPPVLLWDTFGELRLLYAMADVVFVGGSLVESLGGQNFLEPPAQGAPTCIGPHIKHFLWVGREFCEAGLAGQFSAVEELEAALREKLATRLEALRSGVSHDAEGWSAARAREAAAVKARFATWLQPRTGGGVRAADAVVTVLQALPGW